LSRYPYILTSNWAPDFVSKDKTDYTFLSPISVEYLIKMKELSIKYNFKLIIIATPTRVSKKPFLDKLDKHRIVENNLVNEFNNYFENIIYLNDDNFIDPVHLKDPPKYAVYYKNKFLK
jgi:hypothetical protein